MADAANEAAEVQYERSHLNDSHVGSLVATATLTLLIAYSAVILRIVSRRISRTRWGWDDWTIIMSLPCSTAFAVTTVVNITIGYGRHEILVKNPIEQNKLIFTGEIVYTWGVLLFKISALCLLKRIFPGERFKRLLWAVGAFVIAYSLVQTFGVIFTCVPINAAWDPSVKGRCINSNDVYIVCSTLNIVTDAIILSLPMPKLWKLNCPIGQKIQLTIFFALGGPVCIVSIIRLSQLTKVSMLDPSYSDYLPSLLSSLEMAFGTLSASFPTYRPILHTLFGCMGSLQKTKSKDTHDQGLIDRSGLPHPKRADPSRQHPFSRLKDNLEMRDDSTATIPLGKVKISTTAEHTEADADVEGNLGPDEIKVMTDLDQTSRPHELVL